MDTNKYCFVPVRHETRRKLKKVCKKYRLIYDELVDTFLSDLETNTKLKAYLSQLYPSSKDGNNY